jgi:DNA-binding NarL/FixJ family response regulator
MVATMCYTERLTPQEVVILQLVRDGLGDNEIAMRLVLSRRTVSNYVARILDKLGARNRTDAVVLALRRELISLN